MGKLNSEIKSEITDAIKRSIKKYKCFIVTKTFIKYCGGKEKFKIICKENGFNYPIDLEKYFRFKITEQCKESRNA